MKKGIQFRKIIFIASLAVTGLCINSCVGGFVATEPAYVEYSRPQRPSNVHIWIDGDYAWNNQTHVYVQRVGYWEQPRQGQIFVAGHWQSGPKGKSWTNGRWEKQGNQKNKTRR
jgi:hypothetical protein